MSEIISTKPYLIRAMYEWCTDNGYTPYIAVKVFGQVHVPMEFVQNGEIVLNISMEATHDLQMDNEAISFKARFGGVSRDVYIPIGAVGAIYSGENNQGMAFEVTEEVASKKETAPEPVTEKPAVSLAVTNPENPPASGEATPKETRKKPSFTVIK